MDATEHRITMGGEPVRLQPKDFAVLELFMRHPGEVFSSDSILQRVWNLDGDVGSDAVRTSIKRLRKALDKSENESDSIIENIPRVGYRLRAQRQV
jgi:two-component system OmpR family response regulator